MPSFADKLSDDEKRNLAAFVGAGNSVGQGRRGAVSRRTPSASPTAATATSSASSRRSATSIFNEGPKPALARLQTMIDDERRRSPATATASRTGWARRRSRASRTRSRRRSSRARRSARRATTTASSSGRSSASRRTSSRSSRASCAATPQINEQRFLLYQCIHGLGHGLMIYTGYDLPVSLKTCDGLRHGLRPVSCSGGVFMENFNSSYGVTSKYLRKNDPIYPCNDGRRAPQAPVLRARHGEPPAHRPATTRRRPPPAASAASPTWVAHVLRVLRPRRLGHRRASSATKALRELPPGRRDNESDCLYGVVARDRQLRRRAPSAAGASARALQRATARAATRASARCCRRSRPSPRRCARAAARSAGATRGPACGAPASWPRRRSRRPGRPAHYHEPDRGADLQQETTELLQRLIRCNTVNPPGNERALQEMLAAELRDAGFEVDLLGAEPERPNLVARLRGARRRARRCACCRTSTPCSRRRRTGRTTRGRATSPTASSGAAARWT